MSDQLNATRVMDEAINILEGFLPHRALDVTIDVLLSSTTFMHRIACDTGNLDLCSKLYQILLEFSRSQMLFFSDCPTHSRRVDLWFRVMTTYIPKVSNIDDGQLLNIISKPGKVCRMLCLLSEVD